MRPHSPRSRLATARCTCFHRAAVRLRGPDGYDARRAERNPIRRQREVEKYGENESYGWSDDKSRQVSHLERGGFVNFVKKSFGICDYD